MAGRFLGKAVATVSLSVALASVAVRSTGCPAYRYFPDALGWAKRTPGFIRASQFYFMIIYSFQMAPERLIFLWRKVVAGSVLDF